jgi:transmembrane sensor
LQRQIVFDHDELGQAVAEFNRYNDVRIRVDDAALRTVMVSGNFNAYDSDSFIRFLERQPGMHVQRSAGGVIVSTAPLPQ